MKKKFLFLLTLLLMPLVACDMSNANKDDGDDAETSEPGAGDKLSYDKKEVYNKLKNYGKTTGFDITMDVKSVSGEQTTKNTVEVGMKDDMVWLINEDGNYTGIELTSATTVTAFTSEDGITFDTNELGPDALNGQTPEEFYDYYAETLTMYFYMAENYKVLGLSKVKDLTYAGRNATEYAFDMRYGVMGTTAKLYLDKELGINLYLFAEATDEEGNKDSTEFDVKTFLSGNQVSKPNIH